MEEAGVGVTWLVEDLFEEPSMYSILMRRKLFSWDLNHAHASLLFLWQKLSPQKFTTVCIV